MAQELSIENLTIPEKIIESIKVVGEAITSIKITDLPALWESVKENLVNLGKQLVQDIKDFLFKDIPSLIIDVGAILVHLSRKEMDKVGKRAQSALNHLKKVLEVLSLVPIFSVFCGLFLMCIYLCQQQWFLAVCALISIFSIFKILGKIAKGIGPKMGKMSEFINSLKRSFSSATKKDISQMAKSAKSTTVTSTKSNISKAPHNTQTGRQSMQNTAQPQATSSAKTATTGKNTTENSTTQSQMQDANKFGKLTIDAHVKGPTEKVPEFNVAPKASKNIISGSSSPADPVSSVSNKISVNKKLDIDDQFYRSQEMGFADDAPYKSLLGDTLKNTTNKNKFGLQ